MTDKPRIGRPANAAGHIYRTIGVSGTPAEIAAVQNGMTPRQRMEAMLAKAHNDKASAALQKALMPQA